VGWRRVEVKIVLLDVLAVVSLVVGESEQPLLEDWILSIPKSEREAESLLVVGNAGQAIFSPAIGA